MTPLPKNDQAPDNTPALTCQMLHTWLTPQGRDPLPLDRCQCGKMRWQERGEQAVFVLHPVA